MVNGTAASRTAIGHSRELQLYVVDQSRLAQPRRGQYDEVHGYRAAAGDRVRASRTLK